MTPRSNSSGFFSIKYLLVFGLALSCGALLAQPTISGPSCVLTNFLYSYTLTDASVGFSYTLTGGTTSAGGTSGTLPAGSNILQVKWTAAGSVHISATNGSATQSVSITTTVSGGTITLGGSQYINYNDVPGRIACTAASGGGCGSPTYTYQWMSSPNNVSYTNISGATSSTLVFTTGLTSTTYYKRYVHEASGTSAYSNVATIVVYPAVVSGSVSPATQTVNFNSTATLMSAGVSGGTNSYVYQWQNSPDNSSWSNISGATAATYTTPGLTTMTYYRVGVSSNGSSSAYSSSATVNVYPQVVGGAISPATQTINYNTVPGSMSVPTPTGGNGTYTYQWNYGYPGGGTWYPISGATGMSYTPGVLTTTTDYLCVVTSNGATGNCTPAEITVYPQLIGGSVTPSAPVVNYNTSPGMLTLGSVSGGSGTYSYQWQSSTTSAFTSPVSISGAVGNTYTPGNLTSSIYYRVAVTSNGVTSYSNYTNVTVYPQVIGGTVSPASQTINFNTASATLTASGISGGNGIYTYQWNSSPDNINWSTISGATNTTYAPGNLISSTYFRITAVSNGAVANGLSALVTVNPQVMPGVISPAYAIITTSTSPGELTTTVPTGGGCAGVFTYQWQSSTDGSAFANISGITTQNYTPGNLTVPMWYRRIASCSGDNEYSNVAHIVIASGSAIDMNYVRVRTILKAGVTDSATAAALTSPYDVAQVTQYMDGLGREVQTVAKQQTPLQKDFISVVAYDANGRAPNSYLPYPATSTDGNYKPTGLSDQFAFNSVQFPSEEYYYGESVFEPSPLNRIDMNLSPGINWATTAHGIQQQSLVNQLSDSVRLWTISGSAIDAIPVTSAIYAAGTLFKNLSADEAGHQTIEYKDFEGHVILKKSQLAASPGTAHVGWLCTYYIYDDMNSLRFVIQPKGVEAINGSWTVSTAIANELCFKYEYDYRGRLDQKAVPGAGRVAIVYDGRDRQILSQDSIFHQTNQWLFTKYDILNRPVMTGTYIDNTYTTQSTMQARVTSLGMTLYETYAAGSFPQYSLTNSFPSTTSSTVLTCSYYDDYSWVSGSAVSIGATMSTAYTSNSSYFITSYNASPVYAASPTALYVTRSMPTGHLNKVIGSTSQYLYGVNFYDDRGRIVQSQDINVTGGTDTTTIQYDFSGKSLRSLLGHKKAGNVTQSHLVSTKMDYDNGFRLRHIYKNIDNAPADQLIDSLQYNELGQLRAKYLGNAIDSVVYDYNIRGWLSALNKTYVAGSNNHYFGMELGYDKTSSAAPGNTYNAAQYNGNITGTVWKSAGSGLNRKYDFVYDNVNRLNAANFTQYNGTGFDSSANICFTASGITYDANGNILSMNQKGFTVGGSNLIDQLTYSYQTNSNKLSQVTDAQNNPTSLLGDFHYSGSKGSTDYSYDGNGNLITDANKAIDKLNYNYLNLPELVHMNTKGNITYTYDAAGNKLLKTVVDSGASKKRITTYVDGFIYQGSSTITGTVTDTLQFIAHEEGRARWAYHKYTTGATAYGFEYDFFEKDHLGNTRMVLTQQKDTANYLASMEAAYRTNEAQLFSNITNTGYARASVAGYPVNTTITNPNDSVSKVDYNGSSGQKMGPSLLLKVMSGDNISIAVQSYYNTNSITTSNSSFTDVLNSLANGIVNVAGPAHGTVANLTASGSSVYSGLNSFLTTNDPAPPAGYPKAYLNWIFLDDQFNYVSSSSGSVKAASATYPAATLNAVAPGAAISIAKNGYVYIWVSNETQGWDVLFDNLSIQYRQGPLLEENHYYPFGLSMQGISDKALKTQYGENKYCYNGKELQNKEFSDGTGLEEYDFGARFQDGQLGVWHTLDPLSEKSQKWSPYSFCFDNSVRFIDPSGMTPVAGADGLTNDEWMETSRPTSIHVDRHGSVLKNINDGDKNVYEHDGENAKEDVDKNYSASNTSAGGVNIGQIGESIDVNNILSSLLLYDGIIAQALTHNSWIAKVFPGGDWDLKNNDKTIFGLAWHYDEKLKNETKTNKHTFFKYKNFNEGGIFTAADVGNYHAGYTGVAAGMSQRAQYNWAGSGEIFKNLLNVKFKGNGLRLHEIIFNISPNGDAKVDFHWNTRGMVDAAKAGLSPIR